jgi:hypothetical protein
LIIPGEFDPISEGAAGGDNGIREMQRADLYGEVDCDLWVHGGLV